VSGRRPLLTRIALGQGCCFITGHLALSCAPGEGGRLRKILEEKTSWSSEPRAPEKTPRLDPSIIAPSVEIRSSCQNGPSTWRDIACGISGNANLAVTSSRPWSRSQKATRASFPDIRTAHTRVPRDSACHRNTIITMQKSHRRCRWLFFLSRDAKISGSRLRSRATGVRACSCVVSGNLRRACRACACGQLQTRSRAGHRTARVSSTTCPSGNSSAS